MSLHVMGKYDPSQDEVCVIQQLQEMHKVCSLASLLSLLLNSSHSLAIIWLSQMLLERFEFEKQRLEANLRSNDNASSEANSAACCIFIPEILCTKSGFESWQETLPLTDITSFFIDMELLKELSSILLVDPKGLHLVRSVTLF